MLHNLCNLSVNRYHFCQTNGLSPVWKSPYLAEKVTRGEFGILNDISISVWKFLMSDYFMSDLFVKTSHLQNRKISLTRTWADEHHMVVRNGVKIKNLATLCSIFENCIRIIHSWNLALNKSFSCSLCMRDNSVK